MRSVLLKTLDQLSLHTAIGWDIDGTLYRGPASRVLQAFIRKHPDIRHSIVTHRTGAEGDVFADLARYRYGLNRTHFYDVHMCPTDLWWENNEIEMARLNRIYAGPVLPIEIEYAEWKPKICAENGLTALVDDRVSMFAEPCKQYGIELFDPEELA